MQIGDRAAAVGMPLILRMIFERWRASDRVLADVALDYLPAHVAAHPDDHHAAQFWAKITKHILVIL